MYSDLREWMQMVNDAGEMRVVEGAHWDQEIGALTEVAYRQPGGGPMLLFDQVTGYPRGYRVVTNTVGSVNRMALALGMPLGLSKQQAAAAWHEKWRQLRPLPAREVADGPVFENRQHGSEVDLLAFPSPLWHEGDGGRFIGTGCAVITRDPDQGWYNLGTYRMQVHDRGSAFLYISPGKQGRIHRDKYFAAGRPCPVCVSIGHEPLVYMVAGLEVPPGVCEYDVCGGLKGEPVSVVRSPIHGFPIPATAEIVLEGVLHPGDEAPEGPFGEWTGYFGSSSRAEPIMRVEGVYHRRDPIIFGTTHSVPPTEPIVYRAVMRSGIIKEQVQAMGIPDVHDVWCHEVGGTRLLVAISITQRYPGHARQAATAAITCQAGAYLGRYVIVVDADIDVTDLNEVMWAVCTRSEPESSIDILRRWWSGPLDPRIPVGQKGLSSRAIIDATRPFEWRDQFPKVCAASRELREAVARKWAHIFSPPGAV